MQYLRPQSVALRELSKTRQQGSTSTLWELINRSTSEPRGQREDHFEPFSAGLLSVCPQKIENPSTHRPNLFKYYMKSIPNFDSIGARKWSWNPCSPHGERPRTQSGVYGEIEGICNKTNALTCTMYMYHL